MSLDVAAVAQLGGWQLDPGIAYLNHGGFGAVPRAVDRVRRELLAELEHNPTRFLTVRLAELLASARSRLAAFLGADPAGLVVTTNATTGVQTVLSSLDLTAGSEIVTTDHSYGAVRVQLQALHRRTGCALRVARVGLPVGDPADIVAAVMAQVSAATNLVVLDHVASPSGVIFPVAPIAAACRARGVPVLVDGAHAAGMLPVDLGELGVDFWVGNLHKWICAPKTAAVLSIAPQWRELIRPLVASNDYDSGLLPAFDWTGTVDPTPLLAAVTSVELLTAIGWDAIREHNRLLAAAGARVLADALGTQLPVPDVLAGALRTVDLGQVLEAPTARLVERRLFDEHRIQVPVTALDGHRWIRLSAQLYNTPGDYDRLARVLPALLADVV